MFQIPGTLSVKTIHGRFGPFNVAQLDLDIGRFTVKDAILEEYSEGVYQGLFAIKRIFASSYQSGNRFTIETRAELSQIWLDQFEERSMDDMEVVSTADPLLEERSSMPEANSPINTADTFEQDDSPIQLFGSLWPLGDIVKLDPTDRELMRKQINYLKSLAHDGQPLWKFKPQEKSWVKQFTV